jgi:hypothetical protein
VIVNRPVIIQSNVDFAKKSDVEGSTGIPATVNFLRANGYLAAGDGNMALYKRASSEPSHDGKIQDASNAWWELVAGEYLDLAWLGAVPDGETDIGPLITQAVTFAKTLCAFKNTGSTNPRGLVKIRLGRGTYLWSTAVTLDKCNGLVIEGQGPEATTIVWTGAGSALTLGQCINTRLLQKMRVVAGTVTEENGFIVPVRTAAGSRTATLFDWTAATAGGDRFNGAEDFVYEGFAQVWSIGGSATHAEFRYSDGGCFHNDEVWLSDNIQSVNNSFINVDMETNGTCFRVKQGGCYNIIGGSYVNKDNFLVIEEESSVGTGIGTNTLNFNIIGVRPELYQNIDPTESPQLVNCINNAIANILFDGCNAMAGTDDAKTIMTLKGQVCVTIRNTELAGVIACTPNGGAVPYIQFENCFNLPTVTRNTDNGTKYRVSYRNCGTALVPVLDNDFVDGVGGPISYKKSVWRQRFSAAISSAQTVEREYACPEDVVFEGWMLDISRGGGVNITVNIYRDSGKTDLLATQDCGATTTRRLFRITPAYSGAVQADFLTDTSIFVDIVSAGNAGTVSITFTGEYLSL